MVSTLFRTVAPRPETQLLTLSGFATFVSLFTIFCISGPALDAVPEMIIPLGVSAGLGLFTLRVFRRDYEHDCTTETMKYGWVGALIAVAVSGWWIVLHLHYGMPVVGLPEQIATLVTGGIAAGLGIGYLRDDGGDSAIILEQDHLVEEISWASYSRPDPILSATIELFAELEGEHSTEQTRLYDHVDPEIFSELRKHEGDPWHVWFQTERYVFCVSSLGTVAAYGFSGEDPLSTTISFGSDTDRGPSFRP